MTASKFKTGGILWNAADRFMDFEASLMHLKVLGVDTYLVRDKSIEDPTEETAMQDLEIYFKNLEKLGP